MVDLAGNAGTAVTATTDASAVSFDKTAPTLGVVQIAAPGTDTSKAKVGDLVTPSFTASEVSWQSPNCTFKSGGASVSGSATTADGGDNDAATWSCSYTAQSTDTAGNVSFAIGFVDLAGNAGTAVTATTDASAVSFDKTAPTLGVVQIAAPGTDTSKAKVGDLVTLSFTASEALQQSPTCTAERRRICQRQRHDR